MKIAYLDCFSGISGDMLLAALVDSGVPLSVMEKAVASLGLDARLELRRVNRSGIDSAKIDVLTAEGELAEAAVADTSGQGPAQGNEHNHGNGHDHAHAGHTHSHSHPHGRSLSAIREIVHNSGLSDEIQATALTAFELLGKAEAKIHNVPIESIHFHEVGAVDSIADIVAVSAGCHWLKVDRWLCSPLNVGGGHVHCAHGKFPVPAPATLELLQGLPVYSSGVQKELVTPTGAALLRALHVTSSAFPAISIGATGYGAGKRDLPGQPNVLRLVVGESAAPAVIRDQKHSESASCVGIIETTIDDATPELLSYIADKLLAAGASEVYRTPVQMKKGRSGIQLTVLCSPAKAEALRKMIFAETTTLGLRYREETKITLERRFVSVTTEWGVIRIKVGMLEDGEVVNCAPEFEDCRLIAEKHAVPLKWVMQAAVTAYELHRSQAQTAQAQEARA